MSDGFDITIVHSPRLQTGLPERLAVLNAVAHEFHDGAPEAVFGAVLCDGCGRRVDVELTDELPDGWRADATGDYCPACA